VAKGVEPTFLLQLGQLRINIDLHRNAPQKVLLAFRSLDIALDYLDLLFDISRRDAILVGDTAVSGIATE
jgi:hypothetical protein